MAGADGPRPREAVVGGDFVHIGDMVWPNPYDPNAVQWRLRYGEPTRSDLLVAASYVAAYRQLIDLPIRVRNRRVAAIRAAADGGQEVRA